MVETKDKTSSNDYANTEDTDYHAADHDHDHDVGSDYAFGADYAPALTDDEITPDETEIVDINDDDIIKRH